jgi:hypothetical protein
MFAVFFRIGKPVDVRRIRIRRRFSGIRIVPAETAWMPVGKGGRTK